MPSQVRFLAEHGTERRRDALTSAVALLRGRRFVVLTGAGCSTDSGIPDYRGPTGSLRRRTPIQHQDYLRSAETRQRYWARSTLGWPQVGMAQPNAVHHALTALEQAGLVTGIITQNVDGLHGRAGSQRVVELHGSLHAVLCLQCGQRSPRDLLQAELLAANPSYAEHAAAAAPDGDAEFEPGAGRAAFVVPACSLCGGMLKPDVVFFGGNVARPIVEAAWQLFDDASALLVLGTSLAVFSGFRFARGAAERGLPIVVINQGPTRADELAALCIDEPLSPALSTLCRALLQAT